MSEFGFIVCEIGSGSGTKTVGGAEANITTAPIELGYRHAVTGSRFDKTLSATIQICKDPDRFDEDEMAIRPEEFRTLSRWLGRRQFLWFHPIDEEEQTPWFRATFTVKRVDAGGRTIGVELGMSTDSPFGYGEEIEETYVFTPESMTKVITDKNDEVGIIWPAMDVVCQADGELRITNKMTDCVFRVKNCMSGEVISQSGDTKIISSGMQTENLLNFPGSADYEAGLETPHSGWIYSVQDDGSILLGRDE